MRHFRELFGLKKATVACSKQYEIKDKENKTMDKKTEAIHDYEYITAGRFYGSFQKEELYRIISKSNLLDKDEDEDLKKLIFSAEVEECKDETDCANALLLNSVLNRSDYKKEILTNRKQTLTELSNKRQFDNKENWLQFIHSPGKQYGKMFEKAIYLLSVQKSTLATAIINELADKCNCLFIKIAANICRESGDIKGEAKYLILFKRIHKDLLFDEIAPEFESRLREIIGRVPKDIIIEANNLKLNYSCGIEPNSPIGF